MATTHSKRVFLHKSAPKNIRNLDNKLLLVPESQDKKRIQAWLRGTKTLLYVNIAQWQSNRLLTDML